MSWLTKTQWQINSRRRAAIGWNASKSWAEDQDEAIEWIIKEKMKNWRELEEEEEEEAAARNVWQRLPANDRFALKHHRMGWVGPVGPIGPIGSSW